MMFQLGERFRRIHSAAIKLWSESFPQWLTAYPEAQQKRGRARANLGEVAAGRPVGKKQLFFGLEEASFFFFCWGGRRGVDWWALFFAYGIAVIHVPSHFERGQVFSW